MAGLTINLVKSAAVSSLSRQFSSSLVLTPSKPLSIFASFGTSSNAKSPELQIPKKPKSTFFLFREEQYPRVKATNPKATVVQLANIVAQKWGELSDEDKRVYQEQYAHDKGEYNAKLVAINDDPKLSEQLKQVKEEQAKARADKAYRKAKKQKKALMEDLGRPKRKAQSAYSVFFTDQFAATKAKSGGGVPEVAKALSEAWKSLSPEEQAPYISKYQTLKEEYQTELNAWTAKMHGDTENKESIDDAQKKLNAKQKLKKSRA